MGYGLVYPLAGVPLSAHRELVVRLSGWGYTDLWCGEANGVDAFAALTLAAGWNPALRLGTSVVSAFSRGPATLAMAAATVAELAPGRFVLGVGASSPEVVTRWNALPYHLPYGRVRDLLDFVPVAMSGRRVEVDYPTFSVHGFQLERPPAQPPPLAIAALRPKMLRLAGRSADAVVLAWLSANDVAHSLPHLGAHGRSPEVLSFVFACPTDDPAVTRNRVRRHVATYLNVPGYANFHRQLGRGDQLEPMWRAWERGDKKGAIEAVPDGVIDELFLIGPVEGVRERIKAYVAAGVSTPLIHVMPGEGFTPARAVRELAPA